MTGPKHPRRRGFGPANRADAHYARPRGVVIVPPLGDAQANAAH